MSALFALAESYGAPAEELRELRDEILDAKQRMEDAVATEVWPWEVLALWAVREAAKASGRSHPRYGPKVPPRPPIPLGSFVPCGVEVAERQEGFTFSCRFLCGLPKGHKGDHLPPEPR